MDIYTAPNGTTCYQHTDIYGSIIHDEWTSFVKLSSSYHLRTIEAQAVRQLRELTESDSDDIVELRALYRKQYTKGWNAGRTGTTPRTPLTGAGEHGFDDQECGLPKWTSFAETGTMGQPAEYRETLSGRVIWP